VVPLELSASRLQALVREAEALQRQPPSGQRSMELAELRAELAELLCSSGLGAERLLSCVSPDSRLAPRVQSVLLAGALRPSSLQSWLRATAAAAHCLICWAQGEGRVAWMGAGQHAAAYRADMTRLLRAQATMPYLRPFTGSMPVVTAPQTSSQQQPTLRTSPAGSDGEGRMAMVLQPMLSTVELINDDHRTNEAMARLRDEAPEAHRQLVGVAASAYCSLLSPGGQPLPDDTEVWALEMAAASILAASLASPVRWQRELAAWRGSDDGGGSPAGEADYINASPLRSAEGDVHWEYIAAQVRRWRRAWAPQGPWGAGEGCVLPGSRRDSLQMCLVARGAFRQCFLSRQQPAGLVPALCWPLADAPLGFCSPAAGPPAPHARGLLADGAGGRGGRRRHADKHRCPPSASGRAAAAAQR
jgi:hypothetical protein